MLIKISEIVVGDRLRQSEPEKVKETIGLLQPIVVGTGNRLVHAGLNLVQVVEGATRKTPLGQICHKGGFLSQSQKLNQSLGIILHLNLIPTVGLPEPIGGYHF